jgi:hypothetical protein
LLRRGPVPDDAVVKIAQTYRSGTSDVDAVDYVEMFLDDERQTDLDELNDLFVLVNFRSVVTNSWARAVAALASSSAIWGRARSTRGWPRSSLRRL